MLGSIRLTAALMGLALPDRDVESRMGEPLAGRIEDTIAVLLWSVRTTEVVPRSLLV